MTKLILHVGHQKTGTSYLQSVLAHNEEKLANDFYYPSHPSFINASKGHISSGNGSLLMTDNIDFNSHSKILFSGEQLFEKLQGEHKNFLKNICEQHEVKVILYSRNVIDYFFSDWGQAIKRGGLVHDFESTLISRINKIHTYSKIITWIELSESYGFELQIRNYSNHKNDLLDLFMLDVTGSVKALPTLDLPPVKNVNRSLSSIELEFQRVFNYFDKKSGKYISDILVNSLPGINSAKPICSKEIFDLVFDKLNPILNLINSRIEPSEALIIGDYESCTSDLHGEQEFSKFTMEQIEVLGESLNKEFSPSLINKNNANELRDIALKIESESELSLNDALQLMKLAKQLRPNGLLITKKITEWEGKLKNQADTA
jgi:hypothetical protein